MKYIVEPVLAEEQANGCIWNGVCNQHSCGANGNCSSNSSCSGYSVVGIS